MHINIEIKAVCKQPEKVKQHLSDNKARFAGTDHQTDTYFKVPEGRLKLRQGNIENSLIFYKRENAPGPKQSNIVMTEVQQNNDGLRDVLATSIGVRVVVDKRREIYFIENVKFHIDEVQGLGSFVEIEAIDRDGSIGKNKLQDQCEFYMKMFGIQESDLITHSYSDMLLQKGQTI